VSVAVGTGYYAAASSRDIDGWFAGGQIGGITTLIDAIAFSTLTKKSVACVLGTARQMLVATTSPTKAFWAGGRTTGAVYYSMIDTTTYSTASNVVIGSTLSGLISGHDGVNSSTKGYYLGGGISTGALRNTIDSFPFSTEVRVTLGTTLLVNRQYSLSTNNNLNGYVTSGAADMLSYEKFNFSTEVMTAMTCRSKTNRTLATTCQSGGFY